MEQKRPHTPQRPHTSRPPRRLLAQPSVPAHLRTHCTRAGVPGSKHALCSVCSVPQQRVHDAAGAHDCTRKLEPPRARSTSASSWPATIRAPQACARPSGQSAPGYCRDATRRPSQTKRGGRTSREHKPLRLWAPRCTARVAAWQVAAQVQQHCTTTCAANDLPGADKAQCSPSTLSQTAKQLCYSVCNRTQGGCSAR